MYYDAFSSKSSDRNILINTYEQGCSIAFWCRSFTGKERDEETGFGYFGARYLGHELMTMRLSVDPMADKYPSISPYVYCAWNPVRLVDPNGKEVMENEDEWKYNTTTGLLSHVSDKGGNDQQTVHCVSNIGNQEILDETISFNGQIDDMFDFL